MRRLLVPALALCFVRIASAQVLMISCAPTTGPTQAGVMYSATCTASGGIAPYSWSISSGALPAGLTPTVSADTTMETISGTPITAGAYSYTVQVADSTPVVPMTAQQSYSGTIAPAVSSISPISATAGGPAFTLTVNGAGFGTDSMVSFNGTALTPAPANITAVQLTVMVPATLIATAATVPVTVTSGGATSNSVNFTINPPPPPPSITSISPTTTAVGSAAFTLTVNGSDFGSDSVVNFNGQALSTMVVSANQLTASVPANAVASTGTVPVTVTSGGVTSNSVDFTIVPPAITSINPTSATAGGAAFQLTVNGSNFVSGSVVQWTVSGATTTLSTSFTNSGVLTASVPSNLIAVAGSVQITVRTNNATSTAKTFTIVAGPTLDSINPTTKAAGSAGFTLTVNGTGFASDATAYWGNSPLTTTVQSATHLTASLPASFVASHGTTQITVKSAGLTSNALTFTVFNITSLNPTAASAGGSAFTLTVNGNNFVNGAVVEWNGNALATSFVSSTQLTAPVLPNLIASPGTAQITVSEGGAISSALTFTINALGPSLTSLSPSTITAGSGAGLGAATGCPSNVNAVGKLTINGSGFASGATAKWNTQALPTTVVSATQLSACVPKAFVQGYGTAAITVSQGNKTTNTLQISLVLPAVSLTGLQSTSAPTQNLQAGIQLASATPTALQGTLQLGFSTNAPGLPAGYADPGLQFSTGGTTLTFTVPAGASSATAGAVQQGTVEGTITVTLTSLTSAGTNVLPASVSGTVAIPPLPPVITAGSVKITNLSASGFDVVLTGYSVTRDVTTANFSFTAAAGTAFTGATTFSVPVSSAFSTWFSSSQGQANGSMFQLTVPFTISGPDSVLGSVSVTLTNSVGTSTAVSASP